MCIIILRVAFVFLFVFIYVHMVLCIYLHIYTYTYIYRHVYIYIYIYIHIYMCMYIYIYIYIYICIFLYPPGPLWGTRLRRLDCQLSTVSVNSPLSTVHCLCHCLQVTSQQTADSDYCTVPSVNGSRLGRFPQNPPNESVASRLAGLQTIQNKWYERQVAQKHWKT